MRALVLATSPVSSSSTDCTWNIGVEAPSPGSPQQTAQDRIVRAGVSDEENGQESGDEEKMTQIDGNVTLSDIVEEEEKTEPPETRSISLWMNSKDITKEELIRNLGNNDIPENEYYFSTRDGYFIGWNGRREKHVRVYGINVTDFKKTWPKLERMSKTWISLGNLQVHR